MEQATQTRSKKSENMLDGNGKREIAEAFYLQFVKKKNFFLRLMHSKKIFNSNEFALLLLGNFQTLPAGATLIKINSQTCEFFFYFSIKYVLIS